MGSPRSRTCTKMEYVHALMNSQKYNLPLSNLFRYIQVRHFKSHNSNFPNVPSISAIDTILGITLNLKGLILRIHDLITSLKTTSISKIRADELRVDIDDVVWNCPQ